MKNLKTLACIYSLENDTEEMIANHLYQGMLDGFSIILNTLEEKMNRLGYDKIKIDSVISELKAINPWEEMAKLKNREPILKG